VKERNGIAPVDEHSSESSAFESATGEETGRAPAARGSSGGCDDCWFEAYLRGAPARRGCLQKRVPVHEVIGKR